ncbi:unnamed protein product [Brassica rapa]|uniref:SKP1-like protein n=1 Tax=Brassica campestris TaxID=3711 RepID=A0A3P5YBN1_BRACM|nr:unnamed protein product [Brassica rapa]VDC65082.1 unnamed protein product [Brassica rapa]
MSTSRHIVLKSSDGETFEVEEAVALQSQTIAHMVEDDCIDGGIPLANITGVILAKVIEYCKKHVTVVPDGDVIVYCKKHVVLPDGDSSSSAKEELKAWDAEFMKTDQSTLFNLILAANFLNIKNLLDLGCQTVADMITGKTPEEIRTVLNIENDFTPEEEKEIRKENQWAFE